MASAKSAGCSVASVAGAGTDAACWEVVAGSLGAVFFWSMVAPLGAVGVIGLELCD